MDFLSYSDELSRIPQGSILGHIFFTIYDLPECAKSFCCIFADDTKIDNKCGNGSQIKEDIENFRTGQKRSAFSLIQVNVKKSIQARRVPSMITK